MPKPKLPVRWSRPWALLARAGGLVFFAGWLGLAHAKDLGFRYQNGKCLNSQNQEGLNRPRQGREFRLGIELWFAKLFADQAAQQLLINAINW
jgi:hypothetical protein